MYASTDEVADLFGPLDSAGLLKANRLLEYASSMVRQQVPRLDDRLADGSLQAEAVAGVVVAMVVRVLQNPLGLRQGSETIDDYAHSWTVDSALSTGALYISDVELALLQPGTQRLRVGSLRLGSWS